MLPSRDAIGAMSPVETFEALSTDPTTMLVDVRTRAEWAFVGGADIDVTGRPQCFLEWLSFPAMAPNDGFLPALDAEVRRHGAKCLFFICRSGARSHDAAVASRAYFAERGIDIACVNVLEGFEGPLDREGHRGRVAGWKAHGLPWRQN